MISQLNAVNLKRIAFDKSFQHAISFLTVGEVGVKVARQSRHKHPHIINSSTPP